MTNQTNLTNSTTQPEDTSLNESYIKDNNIEDNNIEDNNIKDNDIKDDELEGFDLDGEEIEDEESDDEENDIEDDEFEIEDDYIPPVRPPDELEAEEKVRLMAIAADAVRAEGIEVLDLRPLTIIADFFLICTGKSSIQLRAIADRIDDRMREAGIRKPRMEGYHEATWILLDYGDVVVHVMAAEQREFYRLEEFWNEAPRLELQLLPDEANSNRPAPTHFQTLTPAVATDKTHDSTM